MLKDRVSLVTGGAAGIGEAICNRFAENGSTVFICDRNFQKAQGLAETIVKRGLMAFPLEADVGDSESVRSAVEKIERAVGKLDILVCNAAIANTEKEFGKKAIDRFLAINKAREREEKPNVHMDTILEMSDSEWTGVMNVNINGTFYCCREALRLMIKSIGPKSIVNISSRAANTSAGSPGSPHYAASKAAIVGFTRALARDVATRGIRVNTICPGLVETELTRSFIAEPNYRKAILAHYPMGRAGQPDEIAAAALFLASDDSSFFTGQTLCPNGGSFMI